MIPFRFVRTRGALHLALGLAAGAALVAAGGTAYAGGATPRPLTGVSLWVDPSSAARQQVEALRRSRPADAKLLERIAEQPQAVWVGDWNRDVRRDVDRIVSAATAARALPVLVAYNIPQRDCGSYSAGGAKRADAYRGWIRDFARGLAGRRSVVVLEPDALAGMDCLDSGAQRERVALVRDAVKQLKAQGATVYIDAGHARWHSPEVMATRLRDAGIEDADGFALNVSNYHSNQVNVTFGELLSAHTGGKHFVIDSSRNGVGTASPNDWCNARGQALGTLPSTRTQHTLVDAFLWIKRPGESDGTCGGGPAAGQWWTEYALDLVRRQSPQMAFAMADR